MQRNWIGRSEGAEVVFRCEELGIDYPVFTTRPDTLFGATFFVLAPEHPDVLRLNDSPRGARVREPRAHRVGRGARRRAPQEDRRRRSGRTVTNPVNGEQIPMYVADYVLMEYGTGAIMARAGARRARLRVREGVRLEIRRVIECGELPCTGDGPMVNSGRFDGMHNREAYEQIVDWLESEGHGQAHGELPAARLAALAPALLGLPDPDRPLREATGSCRCRTTSCRSSCPTSRTTRRRAGRRWPRPRTG